jgi:hypothetical protein
MTNEIKPGNNAFGITDPLVAEILIRSLRIGALLSYWIMV